jgi:hypothetical protein
MKIEVEYYYKVRSFNLDGGPSDLTLLGLGNVFIHETGLVLEAQVPKLILGWLFRIGYVDKILWFIYRKTLCSKTSITVPYSQILIYKKIGIFKKMHMIVYKPLNSYGENITVKFRLLRSSKQQEKEFYKILKDSLDTVQSILNRI